MIVIFYIALAVGFILFFLGLMPKPKETISIFGDEVKKKQSSFSAPFLSIFVPVNKPILKLLKLEKSIGVKIALAKWKITPSEFFSAKELTAIFLPLTLYFIFNVKSGLWISAAAVGGFLLPTLILANKVKTRKYSIERVLPETDRKSVV